MATDDKNAVIDVHVSVDCVLIGFDGEQFRVLLVSQVGRQPDENLNMLKLPGSLIYADEDLDEAAKRVLMELTGLKNIEGCIVVGAFPSDYGESGGADCYHRLSFAAED